jgi:hypothetical protein
MGLNLLNKIADLVWIAEDPHRSVAQSNSCARSGAEHYGAQSHSKKAHSKKAHSKKVDGEETYNSMAYNTPGYSLRAQFGIPKLDTQLPLGGLPTGNIHEFFTASPVLAPPILPRIIPCFLACNVAVQYASSHHTASNTYSSTTSPSDHLPRELTKKLPYLIWIGKDTWPSPFLLHQLLGAHFPSNEIEQRCIFVDPPNQRIALWAIENALRTPSIAVVIASCASLSFATSRRFSLAARTYGTLGLLLRASSYIHETTSSYSKWVVWHSALHAHGLNRSSPSSSQLSSSTLTKATLSNLAETSSTHPSWNISLQRIKGSMPHPAEWIIEAHEPLPRFSTPNSPLIKPLAAHSFGEVLYGDTSFANALSLHLSASVASRNSLPKNWAPKTSLRAS